MSAISLKSITGITSITTPAGVDNQLTLHNNNTTERVKIDVAGNVHINNQLAVAGVSTLGTSGSGQVTLQYQGGQRLKTHSWGVEITGSLSATGITASAIDSAFKGASFSGAIDANGDLDVDGHTNLDNVSVAGVTTFYGNPTIYNADPQLTFHDSNHSPFYYYLKGRSGSFVIEDSVNGDRVSFNSTGSVSFSGSVVVVPSLQVSSSVGVVGNINLGSSIIHTNDTDTKIHFPANDTIRFETAGSQRININSSGKVSITNNLDVDGHTNLDNVSIAGVVTATTFVGNGDFVELDVDGHTNLDNVSIAGVTTFSGNTTFGANGSLTSAANFTLSSNGLVIVGSQTVIEAKKAGNATIQCTDTSNNTDLQLRANSEGGLVRTATNYPLILGAYQKEKLRIDGGSYARVGINTSTFDTAGSQLKIEGRGASTTSPPYLQIKGVGSGVLHSYIDLIATSDNNAGNAYRGLGVLMHDEPTNVEWFSGRPYAGSDEYIISRKASPSYRTQSGEKANAFFKISSDGKLYKGGNQFYPLVNYTEVTTYNNASTSSSSYTDLRVVYSNYTPKKAGNRIVIHHQSQMWNGASGQGNGDVYWRIMRDEGSGYSAFVTNERILGNHDGWNNSGGYSGLARHHRTVHLMGSFVCNGNTFNLKTQGRSMGVLWDWYHDGNNILQIWEYDIS